MPGESGWMVPDWPAPAGIRAVFTTRAGPAGTQGASRAPWDQFNLGDHVGDDATAVAANRQALGQFLSARPVFLEQVHGTAVARLARDTPHGTQADAAVTADHDLACTVMVADCLPVLLTDAFGAAIGAAHAGWRGLLAGVLENTLDAFRAQAGVDSSGVMAWLGPCIGPRAFEVGPEVREAFIALDAGASACFRPHANGKYLADLSALARRRLGARGVTQVFGNDGGQQWCTVSRPELFFSYRRDQGTLGGTGRMAACIWRAGEG